MRRDSDLIRAILLAIERDARCDVIHVPGIAGYDVVTTDRQSYHLQLTATSRTAMAALSWTYPADQLIALRRAADT